MLFVTEREYMENIKSKYIVYCEGTEDVYRVEKILIYGGSEYEKNKEKT